MEILFVSAHLPSPRARQAGQKISYYLCQYLAERHTLHLLSFANAAESESGRNEGWHIFASHKVVPITTVRRLLGIVLEPGLPAPVAARSQPNFCRDLRSTLQSNQFDVVILDHMAMWQYAELVTSGALRAGIAHDVLSELWARKAENHHSIRGIGARREARRLQNWERNVARKLDLICSFSDKDSQQLANHAEHVPRCILQPWFARPSEGSLSDAVREPNSIVFSGAFDRRENVDAVAFAMDEILPRVAAAAPRYSFHLAGGSIGRLSRQVARDPRARLAGYVSDLPDFLSRMQIALLPLREGAGIKIKVLECMAAGLAVVTTPVGAEGIPGQAGVHFFVGRTAEELARHTILLLRNPTLCARIGKCAQEFIRDNYDFERSARDFEWTLMQRLSQRQFRARRTGVLASRDEPGPCAPCQGSGH
ncbi:MAG TPA: glycosyltransferase family 4 protein [Terriglobales bacterium]|nr:glycosyltransferase family 4 protein [Terriglobales bacterium]